MRKWATFLCGVGAGSSAIVIIWLAWPEPPPVDSRDQCADYADRMDKIELSLDRFEALCTAGEVGE